MNISLKVAVTAALAVCTATQMSARKYVFDMQNYGISPTAMSQSPDSTLSLKLQKALADIQSKVKATDKVTLKFKKGRYDFHATYAPAYELYISNHDQRQPKPVGLYLDQWSNLTIEGNGSDFIFHGRMIPLVIKQSANCTVKNLAIDFENPQIAQVQVVKNSPTEGITFEVAPWVKYRIAANGRFETYGEGWSEQQMAGMAFERDTKHIVYNTSDLGINTQGVTDLGGRQLHAPNWKDSRLVPGTVVAMRT